MDSLKDRRALYVSYNGITEPITRSQVLPYLKGLSLKGVQFYLLTFEKSPVSESNVSPSGIKWFSLKYHKTPTVPATALDVITGFFYSLYIILKYRIDVVHSRAIVAALIGWPAAKLLSKKFIFDTRGIDSEEYVDAGAWKRGGFIHRTVASLERVITRSSDHVVVLTESFRKILTTKYHDERVNFSVIPCAVDTRLFTPKKNKESDLAGRLRLKDKFVIVYAGSLGTWYMLREMLDFFKVAASVIENAHLLILTQTDKLYAREMIDRFTLDKSRFTLETTTYDMMPGYLSCCDAGISFIKPVFSKISSSPIKFAEYLASGLPVIINSGIGDTEGFTRNNRVGVVVKDFDPVSYQKALDELLKLLKDPGLPARCRDAAERHLSLDKAVNDYYEIYRKL